MKVSDLTAALQGMDPDAELTVDVAAVARALGVAPRVEPTPAEVWEALTEDERDCLGSRVMYYGDGQNTPDHLVGLFLLVRTPCYADGAVTYGLTDRGTAARDYGLRLDRDAFIAKIEALRTAAADLVDSWGDRDWSDGYPFGDDMLEVVENIDGWIKVQREATP